MNENAMNIGGQRSLLKVTMTDVEFIGLIGQDVVVDYQFGNELQQWSMKNFVFENGVIKHKRLNLIIDAFIKNASNPHFGEATHG